MAIIDVVTYNGEEDLLEIRLNTLNKYVDQFIIVEAPTTFSGKPKPLYYEAQKERFKKFWPKIKYYVIDENYTREEIELANSSPNTRGAAHWKHEFLQKESIKKALTHLKDDDIVFIGDCDEIWDPTLRLPFLRSHAYKLKLKVYTYYLNNRSSEIFYGTIVSDWRYLKDKILNSERTNPSLRTSTDRGWHFTSMAPQLERKLTDSYTEESYATKAVMDNLQDNIKNNKDFLGRNFTYTVDESDWPPWLKEHRQNYQHLLK